MVLLWSTDWLESFGAAMTGERLARARRSHNYAHGQFRNPVPTTTILPGKLLKTLRLQYADRPDRAPATAVPVVTRHSTDFDMPSVFGVRATWMGHATVFLEIDDHRLLTDPVWSERASPSKLFGPKRFHAPPITLAELPRLDAILISHDHYDHLDMHAVRTLSSRECPFLVPLGVGAHLERWGIAAKRIIELDWGEQITLGDLVVTATPARHFSGRGIWDRNATLWTSWVVAGPRHKVFVGGDSGYFDAFGEIGGTHGPFDLTLLKIGAYGPTWPEVHMTPEQAVQAHLDLKGGVLLPIHWGTFRLAFHAWDEPADRVVAAAKERGVSVAVPRPGEMVEPSVSAPLEPWWRLTGSQPR